MLGYGFPAQRRRLQLLQTQLTQNHPNRVVFFCKNLLAQGFEPLGRFLYFFSAITKKHTRKGVFYWRREEDLNLRIRSRITRFPIVLLKPLRHLCIRLSLSAYLYYCIFLKKSSIFALIFKKCLKNLFLQAFVYNFGIHGIYGNALNPVHNPAFRLIAFLTHGDTFPVRSNQTVTV